MAYLIDTNVFIRASRQHYGFEFCPAFWDWLKRMNTNRKIYSVRAVYKELEPGDDNLTEWAKMCRVPFFIDPDLETLAQYEHIKQWLCDNSYEHGAINEFFAVADSELVASAMCRQWTVVTHEVLSDTKKKVKIPDICNGLGVKCIDPFLMLRDEKARFILSNG